MVMHMSMVKENMAMMKENIVKDEEAPEEKGFPRSADFCKDPSQMNAVVLEALDDNGVSYELLAHWTIQEERALRPFAGAGHEELGLPTEARQAALSFLAQMPQCVGLPSQSWFEAATLLDMYYLKAMKPRADAIDCLAATCIAIMGILKKNDTICAPMNASMFIPPASMLTKHLNKLGYEASAITAKSVDAQEKHVLQLLGWRVNVSTSYSWINAFVVRFNVFTRNMFVSQLGWIWHKSVAGTRFFMMQQAANPDLSPTVLAAGLFAIGLVSANMLPLEALQPPDMMREEWIRLYKDIQHSQQPPSSDGGQSARHARCVLEILAMAVGVEVADIRKYCGIAFRGMRSAMPPASQHQQSHRTQAD